MIKNFVIYGERCSGTNFLEKSIKNTFELKTAWHSGGNAVPRKCWDYSGHKHFFGFIDEKIKIHDQTLFLAIVRNPYQWMMSFKKREYHQHHLVKRDDNDYNFLYHELNSLHLRKTEIIYDRNFLTNKDPNLAKRFKNIFELREVKCSYLLDTMPQIAKNYYLIRYEDFIDNYTDMLYFISNKFDIPIQNKNFLKVVKPNPHIVEDIDYLNSHINWKIENRMHYAKQI
jgi:hypothetical protein